MSDTVSRQAAIDALAKLVPYAIDDDVTRAYTDGLTDAYNLICQLPSAQPDLDEWCTNCKEYDSDKRCCPRFSRVIREALKEEQPERKKGKWIIKETAYEDEEAKCSCCGFETLVNQPGNGLHMVNDLHFCPNCGADMRPTERNSDV